MELAHVTVTAIPNFALYLITGIGIGLGLGVFLSFDTETLKEAKSETTTDE